MKNSVLRFELQGAVRNWTASIMQRYNLTAGQMIDAFNNIVIELQQQAVQEMLNEIYQIELEKLQEDQLAHQNKEEEMTDGESNIPD